MINPQKMSALSEMDIEDTTGKSGPATLKNPDLTHPIIKDQRRLFERLKEIRKKGAINGLEDPKITTYVIDLVQYNRDFDGPNAAGPIHYDNRQNYENRSKILRKRYHCQPSKGDLSQYYQCLVLAGLVRKNPTLEIYMRLKSARSHSGVLPVTVLTSPGAFSCPMDCHFCPDEKDRFGNRVQPRSYLSTEPACKRAEQNDFDPFLQFYDRCDTLQKIGHVIDKLEVLVLGGTWSFYEAEYREMFIRRVFYAANIYHDLQRALQNDDNASDFVFREMKTLEEEQHINSTSECRIIGVVLETRPDYITKTEIKRLRQYGCTSVQLGMQHTKNSILDYNNRGHHVEASIKALKLLKENGFKVHGHFMPDLPGATPEDDKQMFREVLLGEDLQVDYMKAYSHDVMPFTKNLERYNLPDDHPDKYRPYSEIDNSRILIDVLVYMMILMKPWIRVNRVKRDFPNHNYETGEIGALGGSMLTNLRQIMEAEVRKLGLKCVDIRSREIKINKFDPKLGKLFIRTYRASGGIEYFISIECPDDQNDNLVGYCRLRFNDSTFPSNKRLDCLNDPECEHGCVAQIRDLKVTGTLVKVDASTEAAVPKEADGVSKEADGGSTDLTQHLGIGKRLMKVAEQLAADARYRKISVIAGVGTREYYRKLGYQLVDHGYMQKMLQTPHVTDLSGMNTNVVIGNSVVVSTSTEGQWDTLWWGILGILISICLFIIK